MLAGTSLSWLARNISNWPDSGLRREVSASVSERTIVLIRRGRNSKVKTLKRKKRRKG
jgi:hypothetical protein